MSKPIMTKTKAREWLPAVRKLLRWYQGEDNDCKFLCPLCDKSQKLFCEDCIWILFTDKSCCHHRIGEQKAKFKDPADRNYHQGLSYMRAERLQPWTRNAIERLKRWEKRLLAIIEAK